VTDACSGYGQRAPCFAWNNVEESWLMRTRDVPKRVGRSGKFPLTGRRSKTRSRTTPRRCIATCTCPRARCSGWSTASRTPMERFIPMVEDTELRGRLTSAIDGKGAFRRFKDVLMSHGPERERWFAFRSERLRVFMEAWLSAHLLRPVPRTNWEGQDSDRGREQPPVTQEQLSGRRSRSADGMRRQLRDVADALGARDLEKVLAFAEFVRARRAAKSYVHHHDSPGGDDDGAGEDSSAPDDDEEPSSSPRKRSATS
jgi:hypothetical protein